MSLIEMPEQLSCADHTQIHEISLEVLKVHPANYRIYNSETAANDDFTRLKTDLAMHSTNLDPITGTRSGTILAGHRRFKAAKELGWKTLRGVIDPTTMNEAAEIVKIISHNMQRRKTRIEMARELTEFTDCIASLVAHEKRSRGLNAPGKADVDGFDEDVSAHQYSNVVNMSDQERDYLRSIVLQNVAGSDGDIDRLWAKTFIPAKIAARYLGIHHENPCDLVRLIRGVDSLRRKGKTAEAVFVEKTAEHMTVKKALDKLSKIDKSQTVRLHSSQKRQAMSGRLSVPTCPDVEVAVNRMRVLLKDIRVLGKSQKNLAIVDGIRQNLLQILANEAKCELESMETAAPVRTLLPSNDQTALVNPELAELPCAQPLPRSDVEVLMKELG